MPRHDERDHRGAIDRMARRLREGAQQSGRDISYERARNKAREIAKRSERATTDR